MKNKKQPEIRFKGFHEEWKVTKLGAIAESFEYGLNASAKQFDGINKYIRITDIDDVSHKFLQKGVTSPNIDLSSASNYLLKEGDILFARTGASVGKTYIHEKVDGKVYYAGFLIRARIKAGNNPIFIFQNTLTSNYKQFIQLTSQRSGQPGVNAQEYANYSLMLPTQKEQDAIGVFLKKLDDIISIQQQELETLKQTKQGFLQKMFPKEAESIPEVRFLGFKDHWKHLKLGEALESMYNGQTPSRNKKEFWNGDLNWLTSGELNRSIVKSAVEKITKLGQKDANLKIVPKGTFIIAITGLEAAGTRGNCGILDIDTTLNQSCMALFPKLNLLDTQFLFQWYRMVGENYGLRYTQGTKQQSYNAAIIKDLDICLPDIEEQIKIGNFFKKIDKTIELQEKGLEALKQTKKAFLQKMFV